MMEFPVHQIVFRKHLKDIIVKANGMGIQLNYVECEISLLGTESEKTKNELHEHFNSISNGMQIRQCEN